MGLIKMSGKISMENKIKQAVIDNVRKVMQDELNSRGLNEAILMDFDLTDDFNDEIYLITQIILNDKDITLVNMYKLAYNSVRSFINNYFKDLIMVGRLNKYVTADTKHALMLCLQ
jgi:hypothetical protein